MDFFDLDSHLDEYYNIPLPGTVNCSHVFSMNNEEPGVLKLQNSASNVASTQNLMTGTFDLTEQQTELANMLRQLSHMPKIGLRPIKVIELRMKRRKFFPHKYKNSSCLEPTADDYTAAGKTVPLHLRS